MSETGHPPAQERLVAELDRVARRLRGRRQHLWSARLWSGAAGVGAAWVAVGSFLGLRIDAVLLGLAASALAVVTAILIRRLRTPPDRAAAARWIEHAHPGLERLLSTALEQRAGRDAEFGFLQRRVLQEALAHAWSHDWEATVRGPRFLRPPLAHLAALLLCGGVAWFAALLPRSEQGVPLLAFTAPVGVEILPGDGEVERGSSVVVTARFSGTVPEEATLAWTAADGVTRRLPMARSLSDPVFARTLAGVATDLEYAIEFAGGSSARHRLTVFDLPALVRADATLDYPDYTALETRRIEDTRRVSAVEGTSLEYAFRFNKPLRRAELRGEDGGVIALEPVEAERTRHVARIVIDQSRRLTLHLEDDAGRVDPSPADIRIEALPNRPPELRVGFPRGDQRASPLEELTLEVEARDDFGLLDFGLGFAVGAAEPELVSLHHSAETPLEAKLADLLDLEECAVRPDDLVTWFAWAIDHGPDGRPRTVRGDLRFVEVRPFDEIFREGESGEGRQPPPGGGGGSEADDVLQLQRDISIALWKLRQPGADPSALAADAATIRAAQGTARERLDALARDLDDPRLRRAATAAGDAMEAVSGHLERAASTPDASALEPAWTSSQGAYQELLKLQPRESRVARSQNAQGGGGSGRSQRQLNQLRFRENDAAYETESRAQEPVSPEEREQLAHISRLRELARRQDEFNQRLQELQTALAAARDEEERERVRRELRRLEEEQRRMLADLDELRQRQQRGARDESARETARRLDRTRDDMRRSTEALNDGAVSEALAAGTRAREALDEVRDELRSGASGRFGDELRELRRRARDLAEDHEATRTDLDALADGPGRRLDESQRHGELADALESRQEELAGVLGELRRVTEDAEGVEPGLHRQLYDLLRQEGAGATSGELAEAAEWLRRGFPNQARELQPAIGERLERLRRGVERAADAVLGDDATTLRFAGNELERLERALDGEREGGAEQPQATAGGASGTGAERMRDDLARALAEAAGDGGGGLDAPLTGVDFGEWSERLRTVESLLEEPLARERLASARARADVLRREFRRDGTPPQWELVEGGIVAPLSEVRTWLRDELARRDDPTALQPADRDPVPEAYAEAVRRYYESLGR